MSNPLKLALLCLCALPALAFAGCGDDVPSDGVAKVGDSVIKKSEFDHWLLTAVKGGQQQGGPSLVPDPPDFKKCTAALQKQPSQGGAKPSAKQAKQQCKTQYDGLKNDVMQFLIQAQWVQQEAKRQDVKVSDAEVKQDFEKQKKTSFPTAKAYQQFLKTSGLTEQDILFRVKLDDLQRKLTQKVTKGQGKVTDKDVQAYYAKNKKRFSQPERRDLNVVVTKTKAKADEAKKAIESGQSFKTVAKKFSIDQASKAQGGKLPDVTKGQQEKALATAAFAAKTGKLEGPVKTQFGYYVFQVTKVKKASQQSEKKVESAIRNLLKSKRGQDALNKFIKDFRDRYKGKTKCADDFRISECDNAPKEDKKSQQQQQQQQVPQQGGQQVPQQGGQQAPQQVPQQGGQVPQQQAPQQAPQGGGTQVPQQAPQSP